VVESVPILEGKLNGMAVHAALYVLPSRSPTVSPPTLLVEGILESVEIPLAFFVPREYKGVSQDNLFQGMAVLHPGRWKQTDTAGRPLRTPKTDGFQLIFSKGVQWAAEEV
jgi:hypothetical protein